MKSDLLIRKAIDDFNMIDKEQTVLVGFSGGADSVCLLSFLYDNGYRVFAAHMNHNMRDTAERDLVFCRDFCRERGIKLYETVVTKGSLKNELDARRARYDFFYRIIKENNIDLLATAHNKNDVAETVILHMLRGSSTDGLGGISPVNGKIIRPIIYLKKNDVYKYIKEKGLSYVTDETNLADIYSRNKLRNRFIPMLEEEFNPALVDVLADNSLLIAQDSDYLNNTADGTYEMIAADGKVGIFDLLSQHRAIGSRVLQRMWKSASGAEQNLSARYISDIYNLIAKSKNGSSIDLPSDVCATVEYGKICISKRNISESFIINIKVETEYNLSGGISVKLTKNGKGRYVFICDGDEIILRSKKDGDRFSPVGMIGTKKISDYFTDMKIPKNERGIIPVLEINGRIAAVCGYRTDRDFSEERNCGNKYYIEVKGLK